MSSNNNEENNQTNENNNAPNPEQTSQPTRNITVSIQYSYLFPNGTRTNGQDTNNLASNLRAGTTTQASNDLGTLRGNVSDRGVNSTISSNSNVGGTGSNLENAGGISMNTLLGTDTTQRAPDGAVILSFRDVPASTSQERLDNIISIAAEFAIRRFNDLQVPTRAISKEHFETLPVLKLSDIKNENDKSCSICYDDLIDEPQVTDNISTKKRKNNAVDDNEINSKKKLQKNENGETVVPTTTDTDNVSTANTDNNRNPQREDTLQSEEDTPTYLHSPVELPCKHIFGRECLYKWTRVQNTCPLCRHIIAESVQNSFPSTTETNNNVNMDAFERIRQLIYNTNPNDLINPENGSNGSAPTSESNNNTAGVNNILPDSNVNATNNSHTDTNSNLNPNTNVQTPISASRILSAGLTPFSFGNLNSGELSMPRSGVVYLNSGNNLPDTAGIPASNSSNRQVNPGTNRSNIRDGTTTSNPTDRFTNNNNNSNTSTPRGSATSGNPQRINWIPIPITFIQLDNSVASDISGANDQATATVADDSRSQNAAMPNNSTRTSDHNTTPAVTQSDRLRNILDHIFNVTAGGRPVSPGSNIPQSILSNIVGTRPVNPAPASNTVNSHSTNTSSPASASSVGAPAGTNRAQQAQSFLTSFLRITALPRSRVSNTSASATALPTSTNTVSDNAEASNTELERETVPLFNSGVASYRDRDGNVSTYNVVGEDLTPHSNNSSDQNPNNTTNNTSESRDNDSNEINDRTSVDPET